MAAFVKHLQHPQNAVRGVLGFTGSLVVIPAVLLPVRRRCAKDVQDMEDEPNELAEVCFEMYKPRTERTSRGSELFGWELLDRFNKEKWKDLLSDLVILFNGESMMNLDPYVDGLRAAQREHPDISRIMVTGHSLGGTMAWAVATRLKDLGHADVSGHVFNPGSTWDMDKYFTEERQLADESPK